MLTIGNKAPDFKGINQNGEYVQLSQFKVKR
jgi:peroxiredoxin